MPLLHPALFGQAPLATAGAPLSLATVGASDSGLAGAAASGPGGAPTPLVPGRFLVDEPSALGLWDLSDLVTRLVRAEHVWRPLVRHDPRRRWYTRLLLSGVVEVWLIGWYPGQRTEVHDHGGALGALAVAEGAVDEDECGGDWATLRQHRHRAGALVNFEVEHVHRIVNRGQVNATTIHAYSPPELPLRYAPARGEPVDRSRAVPTAPAQVADRPVPAGVAL